MPLALAGAPTVAHVPLAEIAHTEPKPSPLAASLASRVVVAVHPPPPAATYPYALPPPE